MKFKRLFCFIIAIFLFATCIYAQEKDDMSLFEIDRLIRKTEYDEALRQLNKYIELHPDNFDNAQTRIRRIMNARRQYAALADKLIDLILTDPGNDKEIYEITARLEKFERHPSDQNLQFIADLKKSAEFNYFRAQFMEIQNATAQNTQEGRFIAAIEKAREGFWLYKDDFYEKWEDNEQLIQTVDKMNADLESYIALYEEKNFISKIDDIIDDFIKSVNQDQYDIALTKFATVQDAFANYNNIRSLFVSNATSMQTLFSEVQQLDSDTTDASYLPFMFRFVLGIDAVPNSGILGAVDGQWNAFVQKMNNAVFAAVKRKYDYYLTGLTQNFSSEVSKFVALEKQILDLYDLTQNEGENKAENPYVDYYAICDYVNELSKVAVALNEKEVQVKNITTEQKQIIAQLGQVSSSSDVENHTNTENSNITQLFNLNKQVASLLGEKETHQLSTFEWSSVYENLNRTDWNGLKELYNYMLDKLFTDSATLLEDTWLHITQYYSRDAQTLCKNIEDFNKISNDYIAGFITKIPQTTLTNINSNIVNAISYAQNYNADPELDFGITYSYPHIALSLSSYTQKQVEVYITQIENYKNVIQTSFTNNEQWTTQENISTLVTQTTSFLTNEQELLRSYKENAALTMANAQTKVNAAQLARNEADIRYAEAQNSLSKEDFETARKKLQDALTKYDESLNNLNDDNLRTDVDTKLQNLGERIAKAENEFVVTEVRNLKTQAKDAYFNGRFDEAEKLLNQAKIRWAVTNVTEDNEIVNLLNFINTAISMKTGRDIVPSAPQYPEMSQLLNIAYQYFDEGSRKIGNGFKDEGIKDLDVALENIQKVQYVYPLNQEAALLTLRINRLKDPEKFKEEFAQRIDMAKMMVKNKDNQQEGYANLLDYYELEPNYKGLKELIYQTEIDIGIRQKPVDNSGERRAQRLIADAQRLYETAGNDENKLKSALEKIDEALVLVSDNKTATSLKDRITMKIGGNASTVISTEDERLYQLAIQRLQNNNVVGASVIVEQLMKKSVNANSQKIKDLKNKIDARR